jgi:hypothetical protein
VDKKMIDIYNYMINNYIFNLYIILFFILGIYSAVRGFKLYDYIRKKHYDIWLEATKGGFVWGEKIFQLYLSPPMQLKKDVLFIKLRKKYFISLSIIIFFFVLIVINELFVFL